MKRARILLCFARSPDNTTYSYQRAWPRHFLIHPLFDCTPVDVLDRGLMSRLRARWTARAYRGDAVVLLHSVFSNACMMPDWMVDSLARLPQPKVFFIGNEYKLMPEKMAFCMRLHLALLVSQSLSPEVHALYRARLGCAVAGVPNTGLDPSLFYPVTPADNRPIDLGYRAADAPFYLGHRERRAMADFFLERAPRYGLTVDISLAASDRFSEPEWAGFLNTCKGQLGTEAGGDYFDLDDTTRKAVNTYVVQNPGASFEEVFDRFFREYRNPMPLRILSGRNIEAAGTRTAQILFEGRYDGLFEPDQHYIPLKKDFSNADEAIAKFRDVDFRARVAGNAFTLVRGQLTYDRLIDRFHSALEPFL